MELDQADSRGGVGWMLPGLGKEGVTEGQLLPQRLSVGEQNSGAHQTADGAGSG